MKQVVLALLLTLAAAACSGVPGGTPAPSLSDSARLWCGDNDSYNRGFGDALTGANRIDRVFVAASKLGLPVPTAISDMASAWASSEMSGWTVFLPEAVVEAYQTALPAWRQTPEYARACTAAFEKPLTLGRCARPQRPERTAPLRVTFADAD